MIIRDEDCASSPTINRIGGAAYLPETLGGRLSGADSTVQSDGVNDHDVVPLLPLRFRMTLMNTEVIMLL